MLMPLVVVFVDMISLPQPESFWHYPAFKLILCAMVFVAVALRRLYSKQVFVSRPSSRLFVHIIGSCFGINIYGCICIYMCVCVRAMYDIYCYGEFCVFGLLLMH